MQNTPQRSTRDNSAFMEPIFFETPRIKKFYEINSDLSDERFHKKSHMIFTLMESPVDPYSLAKKNLIMLRGNDFFSETPELSSLADEILDRNDNTPHTSKYIGTGRPSYSREAEHEASRQEKMETCNPGQRYSELTRTISMDDYQHEEHNQAKGESTAQSHAQTYNDKAETDEMNEEYQPEEYPQASNVQVSSNLNPLYSDIMRANTAQENYKQEYPAPVRKHSSSYISANTNKNIDEDHKPKKGPYFTPVQKESRAKKTNLQKNSGDKGLDANLNEYLALAHRFSAVNKVNNGKEIEKEDDAQNKTKYETPVQKSSNPTKVNSGKECEHEHEHDRSTTVGSQLKSGGISEHEEIEKFSRYDKQVIKFGLNGPEGEIRKRKRKSIAQLKQLKIEFDWDDNWDKDRITKISESTGLSESQVKNSFLIVG